MEFKSSTRKEIALREKKRTVVMNTRKLHAWVALLSNPGDHDDMHATTRIRSSPASTVSARCNFPDARRPCQARHGCADHRRLVLQARITGTGHMILMGHRSGNQDDVMIIDYVTRQDIRRTAGPRCATALPAEDKPRIAQRAAISIRGRIACPRLRRRIARVWCAGLLVSAIGASAPTPAFAAEEAALAFYQGKRSRIFTRAAQAAATTLTRAGRGFLERSSAPGDPTNEPAPEA